MLDESSGTSCDASTGSRIHALIGPGTDALAEANRHGGRAGPRISETVAREQARLRNFIRRRVPDSLDAEDILQDVFSELVEAYRLRSAFRRVDGSAFAFEVDLVGISPTAKAFRTQVVHGMARRRPLS